MPCWGCEVRLPEPNGSVGSLSETAETRYIRSMEKMKVWMVVGSFDYEGDWVEDSGKVFFNYEDGVKYGKSLVDGSLDVSYDGYVIKEVEVE